MTTCDKCTRSVCPDRGKLVMLCEKYENNETQSSVPAWLVPLWDAINEYAEACGGDPSRGVYGNVRRQNAVAGVDRVVRNAIDAESDAHERTLEKWRQSDTELGYANAAIQEYERRLSALEAIVNAGGGNFARLAKDRDENGLMSCWFECCKCGEPMDDTVDLSDDQANGNEFKCACGQEYIGVTHIMLHAFQETEGE